MKSILSLLAFSVLSVTSVVQAADLDLSYKGTVLEERGENSGFPFKNLTENYELKISLKKQAGDVYKLEINRQGATKKYFLAQLSDASFKLIDEEGNDIQGATPLKLNASLTNIEVLDFRTFDYNMDDAVIQLRLEPTVQPGVYSFLYAWYDDACYRVSGLLTAK